MRIELRADDGSLVDMIGGTNRQLMTDWVEFFAARENGRNQRK